VNGLSNNSALRDILSKCSLKHYLVFLFFFMYYIYYFFNFFLFKWFITFFYSNDSLQLTNQNQSPVSPTTDGETSRLRGQVVRRSTSNAEIISSNLVEGIFFLKARIIRAVCDGFSSVSQKPPFCDCVYSRVEILMHLCSNRSQIYHYSS
jgi:hypothetical protein